VLGDAPRQIAWQIGFGRGEEGGKADETPAGGHAPRVGQNPWTLILLNIASGF